MTNLDLVAFLAAGVVGAQPHPNAQRGAWVIIAVWAALKLLHVI